MKGEVCLNLFKETKCMYFREAVIDHILKVFFMFCLAGYPSTKQLG